MRKWIAGLTVLFWVLSFYNDWVLARPVEPQLDIQYYSVRTKDTVTPEGIYNNVFVYIAASSQVLDKIDHVVYRLDENFFKPEVVVSSRKHQFQLELKALTHFSVSARVYFKDGKVKQLDRYLLLGVPKPKRESIHPLAIKHSVLETPVASHRRTYRIELLLEGRAADLAQVDHVEYYFPPDSGYKTIKVSNPSTDFRIETELDRQLTLQAYVYFKDGVVSELVRFIYFKFY